MEQQAQADAHSGNRWSMLLAESKAKTAGTPDAGSSVPVTALSEPDRERPHCLVELSRATLRLMGDKPLAPNELIAVELPHHLLLADVKRSVKQANAFTTDAARIVTIPKTSALETASKSAKIDALIADLHLQCQVQLSTLERSIASLDVRIGGLTPADRSARLTADFLKWPDEPQLIENASAETSFSLTLAPTPNAGAVPAAESSAPQLRLGQHRQADPTTFEEHMALLRATSTVTAPIEIAPFDTAETDALAMDEVAMDAVAMDKAAMDKAAKQARKRRSSIAAGLAAVAVLACATRLVGPLHKNLNPLPLAHPLAQPLPLAIEPLASAAPQIAPSNTPPPSVAIPVPVQAQSPQPIARDVAQEVAPAVDNASAVLHASIKATDPSWVSVCYDGKERFQKMFAAGETREIYFSQLALVRLGNGPKTEVALGGRSIPPDGPPGVVRAMELNHDGVHFVNYRASSPACGNAPDAADSAALTAHQ